MEQRITYKTTHTTTLLSFALFCRSCAWRVFVCEWKGAVYIFVSLSSHLTQFFLLFSYTKHVYSMRVVNHNLTACFVHLANEVGTWTHRRYVCVFVRHRDATANEQDVQLTRAGVDIGSVWKSVIWHLNGIFSKRSRQFKTLFVCEWVYSYCTPDKICFIFVVWWYDHFCEPSK